MTDDLALDSADDVNTIDDDRRPRGRRRRQPGVGRDAAGGGDLSGQLHHLRARGRGHQHRGAGDSVRFRIHVAPDDMGRVIGRRGRVAQAIRTVVAAAGARDGVQTSVDIVDD